MVAPLSCRFSLSCYFHLFKRHLCWWYIYVILLIYPRPFFKSPHDLELNILSVCTNCYCWKPCFDLWLSGVVLLCRMVAPSLSCILLLHLLYFNTLNNSDKILVNTCLLHYLRELVYNRLRLSFLQTKDGVYTGISKLYVIIEIWSMTNWDQTSQEKYKPS